MSQFLWRIFCVVIAQGFLVVFFTSFSTTYAQVDDTFIEGPQETPIKEPGLPVPYPGSQTIIYPGNDEINVTAQVGEFVINLNGLASPNASIVIEDNNGQLLRSTVANNDGYFSVTALSVRRGFDEVCFEAIDFERLGNSESCLELIPITEDQDINNVYLPPSIGLFSKQINAGQEALVYGYSMPGAEVDVRITETSTFSVTADSSGYYEYRYQEVPAGTYTLSSVGEFEELPSLEPLNTVELEALSLTDQITETTEDVVTSTGNVITTTEELLTDTLLGFLLLVLLLILIIIIILIFIFKPAWARALFDKFGKKYKMHHDWLLDFIDQNQSDK